MLESLHIENVAVISRLDLDLTDGFTVFTGETGAGKSVIIDSIRLLLGGKADRELLRYGESRAVVSGIFSAMPDATAKVLESLGVPPDEDGCLFVERTLTEDGKSVAKVNGKTVTLSVLREAASHLLDIHGQNASSLLMREDTQRNILDTFGDASRILSEYLPVYTKLTALRKEIREVTLDEAEKTRMIEMLRYQTSEIETVSPKLGEEEKLYEKRALLRNSEKINRQTGFVYKALRGAEKGSVHYLISRSLTALESLTDVIPTAREWCNTLSDTLSRVDDIAEEVYALSDDSGDPVLLLDKIEGRLDAYAKLHRKYGADTAAILSFYEKAKEDLDRYENADKRLSTLKKQEAEVVFALSKIADRLRAARKKAAETMVLRITEILRFLDMPKVLFTIDVTERRDGDSILFTSDGADTVAFRVAANPGEEPLPLVDAASGGELQRIMLAVKTVVAANDGIPTVIYDEADAGVSGKTARKIGFQLKENARDTQILCVTHSAQIASLADKHLLIGKIERNGRAETTARVLSKEERISELSRILGGIEVTDAQRSAARDLLENLDN